MSPVVDGYKYSSAQYERAQKVKPLGEGSLGFGTGDNLTQPNLTFFTIYRKPTNGTTTTC